MREPYLLDKCRRYIEDSLASVRKGKLRLGTGAPHTVLLPLPYS